MKFFKFIIIILLFICINKETFGQYKKQIYYIHNLQEYEIIDNKIGDILDTMLFDIKDCLFDILNIPYHFWITTNKFTLDTAIIEFKILPYSYSLLYRHFINFGNKRAKGFLYYKNILVLIDDEINVFNNYLKKLNNKKTIYYESNQNIRYQFEVNVDRLTDANVRRYYLFCNDVLLKDYEKYFPCFNKSIYGTTFLYQIEKNDTWESIAEKCYCPKEILQNVELNDGTIEYQNKLPNEDFIIILNYQIKEGKIIDVIRIQ